MLSFVLVAAAVLRADVAEASQCWDLNAAELPICRRLAEFGRFERVRAGPVVEGKPTLEFVYHPGWGTSINEQSVVLLQLRSGVWEPIWTHRTLDGAYTSDFWSETKFKWRKTGPYIRVTGRRTDRISEARTRVTILPAEAYCYRTAVGHFVACD